MDEIVVLMACQTFAKAKRYKCHDCPVLSWSLNPEAPTLPNVIFHYYFLFFVSL